MKMKSMTSTAGMRLTVIVDDELGLLGLRRQMPEKLPIHGIDAPEIFINQAGMAFKKTLQEKRLAEPLKERK